MCFIIHEFHLHKKKNDKGEKDRRSGVVGHTGNPSMKRKENQVQLSLYRMFMILSTLARAPYQRLMEDGQDGPS